MHTHMHSYIHTYNAFIHIMHLYMSYLHTMHAMRTYFHTCHTYMSCILIVTTILEGLRQTSTPGFG